MGRTLRLVLGVLSLVTLLLAGVPFAGGRIAHRPGRPAVRGDGTPLDPTPAADEGRRSAPLYIACVQLKLSPGMYQTPEAYHHRIDAVLRSVARRVPQGAQVLVTLPEDLGTFLVLEGASKRVRRSSSLEEAIGGMVKMHLLHVTWLKLTKGVSWVRALALDRSARIAQVHDEAFAALARKYGYWISAGTICLPELDAHYRPRGRGVYNVAEVFAPSGRKLASQRKVHLIDMELRGGLDLVRGELAGVSAFEVAGRRVGLAICYDAFHPDVLDALGSPAAPLDILIQPSANPGPWTPDQQREWLGSAWQAVVQDRRASVGVNPMLVGDLFGLSFQGQSSVVAAPGGPLALPARHLGYKNLPPEPGFGAVARDPRTEEILVVKLD